jgi:hypothetical protein
VVLLVLASACTHESQSLETEFASVSSSPWLCRLLSSLHDCRRHDEEAMHDRELLRLLRPSCRQFRWVLAVGPKMWKLAQLVLKTWPLAARLVWQLAKLRALATAVGTTQVWVSKRTHTFLHTGQHTHSTRTHFCNSCVQSACHWLAQQQKHNDRAACINQA